LDDVIKTDLKSVGTARAFWNTDCYLRKDFTNLTSRDEKTTKMPEALRYAGII